MCLKDQILLKRNCTRMSLITLNMTKKWNKNMQTNLPHFYPAEDLK